MNPALAAKAAALVPYIVALRDGSFRVPGEHGTYRVTPRGDDYACDCLARTSCKHRLAVLFLTQSVQQKAS